ncbi:MAG: C_GCAxxG_C_C family protein [Firmicutes bacterium]|nr:C_GCAxxG_C_C family protein [Bacillota bacterium]
MDRKEQALDLHKRGFNCAQSVACSFCNVMGADPETTFRLAEPFGLGIGAMETCGAVSGMAMVVGMKMSDGDLDTPKTKRQCYDMMQTLIKEFKEKNSSIVCSEIKGIETGTVLRSCNGCIEDAVELLDKHLLGL